MKPDWKDAPEWAQYVAMDRDGTWYWYEVYPSKFHDSWISSYKNEHCIVRGWEESLEERP